MTYLVQVTRVGFADLDFRASLFGVAAGSGPHYTYHIYDRVSAPTVLAQTGQTNYLFNRGYITNAAAPGPFRYSNKSSPATAFSNVGTPTAKGTPAVGISDGTSNTIMFLESAGGFLTAFGTSGWLAMNWGHAPFYSDFGTCPDRANPNCDFSTQGRGLGWAIPSSQHGGNLIMSAFCDGSVRGISPALSFPVFVYTCGATDGQVVIFN
jgi:hypothetical protein